MSRNRVFIQQSARELERRRQSKAAQGLPVLLITHAEFATIRQVGSHEEVADLAKTHDRLKMKGDCGNWFVCYPNAKENQVWLVKFIRERQRTKLGGLDSSNN